MQVDGRGGLYGMTASTYVDTARDDFTYKIKAHKGTEAGVELLSLTDDGDLTANNLSGTNTGDQVIPITGVDFDPVGTDNSPEDTVNEVLDTSSTLLSLDWDVKTHYYTLAGASGINTEINLPAAGDLISKTISIYVQPSTFSFAFPALWTTNGSISGALQASVLNTIVVEYVAITGTPFYRILISQAD
jgi:hypothetical protein